jgi:hypothetical protein
MMNNQKNVKLTFGNWGAQRSTKHGRKRWFVLAAVVCTGIVVWQGVFFCSKSDAKKRMQACTGFVWPAGTKGLEWQFGGLQSTWIRVHLQLPHNFQCESNFFFRYNPSYNGAYDAFTMDENRWSQQNRLWQESESVALFRGMRHTPAAGSNLFFRTNLPYAFSNTIPWAIVYDEARRQMWIFTSPR